MESISSFYLAKSALQVLDNAVYRCDNKTVINNAASVEKYAQNALQNKEIDLKMYDLRIKSVLDAIAERFQKNCTCNQIK
jgi:hypothetical protein